MNPRIRKEARALLPTFWVTVLATLAASLIWQGKSALFGGMMVFALCCTLMGASCFGNEFHWGTMSLLLSQPLPRSKIWLEKLLVLGIAVALSFSAWLLCIHFFIDKESVGEEFPKLVLMLALIPLGVFCTTPCLALKNRNTIIAAALGFCYPIFIWAALALLVWLFSLEGLFEDHPYPTVAITTVIYCALLYRAGYLTFRRFQTIDSQAQEIGLPEGLEAALAGPVKKLVPGYTGSWTSLLRKELQVQKASYLIAGLLCVVAPVEAVAWKIHPSEAMTGLLVMNIALCVLVIPLITTGVSVAEERSLGVAGWQLTLPPSTRRQWTVKLLSVLATCVLLGVALPSIMGVVGAWLFSVVPRPPPFSGSANGQMTAFLIVLAWALGYLSLLSLGVFASSISTTSFRAIILTIGLFAAAATLAVLTLYGFAQGMKYLIESRLLDFSQPDHWLQQWRNRHLLSYRNFLLILSNLLLVILLGLVHGLAFANYRKGELTAWRAWIQASVIMIFFAGAVFLLRALVLLPALLRSSS